MSGLVISGSGGGSASPFLILLAAAVAGRKSATAAAITTASAPFTAVRMASRSSSAEPARTTCTEAGSPSSAVCAATSVTCAPRWAATAASA